MLSRRLLLTVLAVLTVLCAAAPASARERVIAGGHEQAFLALVAPFKLARPILEDRVLSNIEIHPDRAELEITRGVNGPRLAVLEMSVDAREASGFRYSTVPARDALDGTTRRALEELETRVRDNAGQAFQQQVLVSDAKGPRAPPPDTGESPPFWMFFVALGVALLLVLVTRRAGAGSTDSTLAFAGVCVASLAMLVAFVWCVSAHGQVFARWVPGWDKILSRDRAVARLALAVAAGSLVAAAYRGLSGWKLSRQGRAALLATSGVLAWSVLVRLVLTRANVLNEGALGYRRLMDFLGGYGGLSVIVDLVAPAHMMWSAIRVPIVLSALAPPLLTVLAQQIGLRRPIPLLAGLMLASIPLHAAMFTSDFLMGPALSLSLGGLALAAAGSRSGTDLPVFAGAALLGYVAWVRPEAGIVGAPLLVVAWPVVRAWRSRPGACLGLGFFGANMIAAQAAQRVLGPTPSLVPSFPFAAAPRFLATPEVVPYWLSLGIVLVVVLRGLSREHVVLFAVGIVSGMWPVALRPMRDPTESFLDLFRYAAWMLPWITLLAASGWVAVAERAARRFGDPARPGRAHRVLAGATAAVALFVLSSPIRARRYLAREYGPRAEERVFRQALGRVPVECTLIVPDDVTELGRRGKSTIEIEGRYRAIAAEASRAAGSPPHDIAGVTDFLDGLARRGWPRNADGSPACFWFFQGSYCFTGPDGVPAESCSRLLSRVHGRPVLDKDIEYITHRFVSRPRLRTFPLYDPHQHLHLLELSAPRD